MSSNTFQLAKKTNNGSLNQAVGPGQGNQKNDEGRLKYYEVNIISIMIDHIVLPYFTCVLSNFCLLVNFFLQSLSRLKVEPYAVLNYFYYVIKQNAMRMAIMKKKCRK